MPEAQISTSIKKWNEIYTLSFSQESQYVTKSSKAMQGKMWHQLTPDEIKQRKKETVSQTQWTSNQFRIKNSMLLSLERTYRLGTKRQCLFRTRKAIREFPKPWFSIIILLKPSKGSTAGTLTSVPFHHMASPSGSTFFHLPFLSFFHPVKKVYLCYVYKSYLINKGQ